MPFGAHETMEVHEILNEKINLINHFMLYAQQCQNQRLRQMIDHQMQTAIQSYNQLVAYTHDYAAANQGMSPAGGMHTQVQPENIHYGLRNPAQQMPQQTASLNDTQIVRAMLSCHKASAKLHLNGALECADPNVREMLMNGAITCTRQAYDVFLMMNEQGLYQVPTINDQTAKTFLHSYQPMQQTMMPNMASNTTPQHTM